MLTETIPPWSFRVIYKWSFWTSLEPRGVCSASFSSLRPPSCSSERDSTQLSNIKSPNKPSIQGHHLRRPEKAPTYRFGAGREQNYQSSLSSGLITRLPLFRSRFPEVLDARTSTASPQFSLHQFGLNRPLLPDHKPLCWPGLARILFISLETSHLQIKTSDDFLPSHSLQYTITKYKYQQLCHIHRQSERSH
jgi:hypothetical protein